LTRRRSPALRFAGRVTALAITLLVVTLVSIQFARAIGENVAAAHELATIRSDIATLRVRRVEQRRRRRTGDSRSLASRAPERSSHFCLTSAGGAAVGCAVNGTSGGIVINLNAYGATVRLDDGDLASASAQDVETHRDEYQRSLMRRKRLAFEVRREGRRCAVSLAPQIRDETLEEQIASYLRSTEEWEPADGVPAAQRHFLRKKRRAAFFESKHR
jgi:hypothetical protein